jgi:hypothetical protein
MFFSAFWYGLGAIVKKWRKYSKRNMILSCIVVLFLIHPTITSNAFDFFLCYSFEGGVSRLQMDTSVRCWSAVHLLWVALLGIPMFVFWVFGLPLVGFTLLFINRKKLTDPKVVDKYLVLYKGL